VEPFEESATPSSLNNLSTSPLLKNLWSGVHKTILSWGKLLKHVNVQSSTRYQRLPACFADALAWHGENNSTLPDFWISTRTDQIFFAPLPNLNTLPKSSISARARMAHLYEGLTSDHFSWQFYDDMCVDDCVQPCSTFQSRFFMADDQFSIVPNVIAAPFFNTLFSTPEQLREASNSPFCINFTRQREYPEQYFFTCPLLAKGLSFSPLAISARLSAHSRRDSWYPQHIPLVPPHAKNCF